MLRGNTYGVITGRTGAAGWPTQVELVPTDAVSVTRLDNGTIEYRVGGTVVDNRDIWHLRGFTVPGAITGLSPIAYARQSIGLGLAAERFGASFFQDNATPSAVLIAKNGVSAESADVLKARWNASHKGHRSLAVMSGDLEFKPITISPTDSQFVETARLTVSQVARVYGVPPEMVGGESGGSLTYSNVEARALDYVKFTLGPWIARLEAGLTDLLPRGQFAKLNAGALLRADTLTRYQAHAVALSNKFMTVEEVRALEDLGPWPRISI
jgi:HK97 family phage portal protein